MNWVVMPWSLKSWTRWSSSSSSSHVSVTVTVILFALFSFLLSCTTLSLSGSALVSFTISNMTAFFINDDFSNNPMIIAANASDNIAAAAAAAVGGGIYQGSSLNLSYSNSTTTVTERNPSIQSVVTDDDLPAAPGLIHWEEDESSRQEESESLGSNSTTTTTKTEAQVLSAPPSVLESSWVLTALTPADQQQQQQRVVLDSREESESGDASYGVEDQKDRSWSPSVVVVLGPSSLVDETTKPGHMNQAAEDEEEAEAEAAATAAAPISPTPSPAILPLPDNFQQHPSQQQVEKFLMPILSYQVGAGNQLMEYMSAAIIARALNRTLCLPDFFPGPTRHTGISVKRGRGGEEHGWLAMENRYDEATLSRFMRVASNDNCLKQCHSKLDALWLLKPMREPILRDWKSLPTTKEARKLSSDWLKWQTPGDIAESLGSSNEHCVGVGGLYPGPRWRGGFLAVSAFLQPSKAVATLVDKLQELAIGINVPYLAVHWRFEESECGPHKLGLCFVRCSDGAVIDSGLHPNAKEWIGLSIDQCRGNGHASGHFRGVGLDKFDVFDAIFDHAQKNNVKTVYLATDGWIRGEKGVALVQEAVEELRNRGLAVVGLWKIKNLPNFSNGRTFDPESTLGEIPVYSQQIALIEQEICTRSTVFLGSGQSTWSLAVFRLRLARRRAKQILESRQQLDSSSRGGAEEKQLQEVLIKQIDGDEAVIEELMKDKHAAGLACRFARYFNRIRFNATVETYVDEAPDGWLDLEACEGRIGQGGKCEVAKCF
ncbi:unnamed protein product [Sphagnum troendelagicum]|uniref:O-fucosyltransferase family protein n=1 Tax=Sphagnum troendelagicum TaxID=128251 RepID=A0ABP0U6T2_9BRYO